MQPQPPSDNRYTRIRELFDRAIELPIPERGSFVRREAGEDTELVEEVLRLLAAWAKLGQ